MDMERRFLPLAAGAVEIRENGIGGTASVTRSVADLGDFTEEIAPGAFDDALTDSDVRGLFNHDSNFVLGRFKPGRRSNTMTLRADDDGLHYEIPDLPESRSDVREAIARGDVDGNSFSFSVAEDAWATRDGRPHRTIKRVAKLYDVGPVTFPAYEETTVSARSRDKARELREQEEETKAPEPDERLEKLEAEVEALRRRVEVTEAVQDA